MDLIAAATTRFAGAVSVGRLGLGAVTIGVLGYTYVIGIPADGANPFNYFGYFTNLTSLLTGLVLIAAGANGVAGRSQPGWLVAARATAVTSMIVVGVIYNTLIPGTGSAPVWVSVFLHTAFPLLVAADWMFAPDRVPLPWRKLWIVLPYPLLWLAVVLARGATDGWVPYGFLLPSNGLPSLLGHIAGLLLALIVAAALVWASSRLSRPYRSSESV